ncbi:MAG: hypothetical protein ABSB78_12545 [Bacteroidota bacterium]
MKFTSKYSPFNLLLNLRVPPRLRSAIQYAGWNDRLAIQINTGLLKPGDVLLSRSRHQISDLIAISTLGPFSHAAIIISPYFLFESVRTGIGSSPLFVSRSEWVKDRCSILSRLDKKFIALILRHPILDAIKDGKSLSSRLRDLIQPFRGLEYPSLIALATALSKNKKTQKIAKSLLQIADSSIKHKKVNPGPFCSQLVAIIYQSLGISLFDHDLNPDEVNPNSFLLSHLEPVYDVLRYADFSAKDNQQHVEEINSMLRPLSPKRITLPLVTAKRLITLSNQFIESFEKMEQLLHKSMK